MKRILIALLLMVNVLHAQEWQAEIMVGGATYNGDLSQKALNVRTIRPTVNINLKYEFYYLVLRAGFTYGHLTGDDKYNKDVALRNRNLSFRTNIWEFSVIAEYNLVEPDIFHAYPYLFAGIGMFRFDPYSFDNEGKKVRLHPLRTEGQGLPEFPDRKKYSLIQPFIPVGGGWKWKISEKLDLAYEVGYKVLFTDYLDDVSTTYVSPAILTDRVGAKSAEMANRAKPLPGSGSVPGPGDPRGNPNIKDSYFMMGMKLILHLEKRKN